MITHSKDSEKHSREVCKNVRKESTIFVVSVKSIIEEEEMVVKDVVKLLEEYKDVFSIKSPPDLPSKRGEDDHVILTVLGVRLQARFPYRLTPEEREVLKTRLKELTETGHIRPSSSPWEVLVLFMRKKDGDLRMCIDYRALNKMIV
jgi:hypothetical protein